jgi:putative lipoprotein
MLSRFAELLLFGVAPLLIGLVMMPAPSSAAQKSIKGEVLYRERIALPPDAVLNVQLLDVSLADAPAEVVAEQTIEPAGQVPIPFNLTFDATDIKSGRTYVLQARITVGDTLWFITDTRHAIDPLAAAGPQTMIVKMVRQSQAPSDGSIFDTTWLAEGIKERGVIDDAVDLNRSIHKAKAEAFASAFSMTIKWLRDQSRNSNQPTISVSENQ